jgi:hypothetical protein
MSGRRIDNLDTSNTGQLQYEVVHKKNETQRTVSGHRQVAELDEDMEITSFATLLANNSPEAQEDLGYEDEDEHNSDEYEEFNIGEDPDEYDIIDKGHDADKSESDNGNDGMDAIRQRGQPKPAVAQKRVVSGKSEKPSKGARRVQDSDDDTDPETCRESILYCYGNNTDLLGSVQDPLCCQMF